jgi:hypothetical protein
MSNDLANTIMREFPRSHFGDAITKVVFSRWADESHSLARSKVYLAHEGDQPTADYVKEGQRIVKERVALAGYRLAYLLNNLLSENGQKLFAGCR